MVNVWLSNTNNSKTMVNFLRDGQVVQANYTNVKRYFVLVLYSITYSTVNALIIYLFCPFWAVFVHLFETCAVEYKQPLQHQLRESVRFKSTPCGFPDARWWRQHAWRRSIGTWDQYRYNARVISVWMALAELWWNRLICLRSAACSRIHVNNVPVLWGPGRIQKPLHS